jgi:hypothetical protein
VTGDVTGKAMSVVSIRILLPAQGVVSLTRSHSRMDAKLKLESRFSPGRYGNVADLPMCRSRRGGRRGVAGRLN